MRKNRIVQLIGIGLILASLVLIGFLVVQGRVARQENEKVVFQIAQLLPPRTPGIMDQYTVMEMPVLQVKGQDYIALLEAPGYGIKLPVRSSWSAAESRKCPCRFYGTVYDGSLVVGGQAEQLGL